MKDHAENVSRRLVVFIIASCFLVAPGCVELGIIPPPDNGGAPPTDGGNGNGGGDEDVPRVRLSVSNQTPQLNEQVALRCLLTNDPPGEVVFDFQASGGPIGRVVEDEQRGTATFIVQESDIGVAVSVTCTATNDLGTGPRSAAQVIVATAPEPPLPPP